MRILTPFAISLVLATGVTGAADGIARIELAFPGDFRGPGTYPPSGTTWFALNKVGSRFELVQTRIETQRIPDSCVEFATRIKTTALEKPLFLVRGSERFKPGPVDTVFHGARFIFPAEHISFKLESGTWVSFSAFGSVTRGVSEAHVANYEIHVPNGQNFQVLAEFARIDMDGPPQLIWAGDLDRDGKADALFDLTKSYAGRLYVLFLSTRAGRGEALGEVARFPVMGC